jgi:cytochrome P450
MADRLVSDAVERGRVDVMETIAHHLPSMVMAQLLHIPEADHETFAEWTTDIGLAFGAVGDPEINARVERSLANLDEYVVRLVAQRRKSSGDDLLSELIRVEEDGDKLSTRELVDLIENLLFAGHDTTRGSIGALLWLLIDNPEAAEAVRSDPSIVPNAVDEVLRYEAITFSTSRTASEETVVGGVRIAAGTPVGFCLPAASRDPVRYDRPMVFHVRRPNPAPPTFGAGMHYCIGAALARIELEELMHSVNRLTSSIHAVAEPQWMPFAYIRRYESFQLSLRG